MISYIAVHNVVSNMPEPTKDLANTISLWGMVVCVIALIVLTYFKIRLTYVHRVSIAGLYMIFMLSVKSLVHKFDLSYTVGQLSELYPNMKILVYKKFWVWGVRELAKDKVMFDYVKATLSSEEKQFVINYQKLQIDDINVFYQAVNKYYTTGEKNA